MIEAYVHGRLHAMKYEKYHGNSKEDYFLRVNWGKCPAIGVFVDVGAGDPVDFSHTYHFEQNDWTGLLIDADIRRCEQLQQFRSTPVEWCAITLEGDTAWFQPDSNPDLSRVIQKPSLKAKATGLHEVPAHRLETLLVKHNIGIIDILNIDVEGSELAVWDSMIWSLHRPRAVIIEYNAIGEEPVHERLAPLKYRQVYKGHSNLIYLAEGE